MLFPTVLPNFSSHALIPSRLALAAALPLFILVSGSTASAATFDEAGHLHFAKSAVATLSFESPTTTDQGEESKGSSAPSDQAIEGSHLLLTTLKGSGLPLPIDMPNERGSFAMSYWVRGDCRGGVAVDDTDGAPINVAFAFPSGRMTSDGWIEMQTGPFQFDGTAGWTARLFLVGYDGKTTLHVDVDAVEVVPVDDFSETKKCHATGSASACGEDALCVEGRCINAAGWFPPLPPEKQRGVFVDVWTQKIRDSFGPYGPRHVTMPDALDRWQLAKQSRTGTTFWTAFAATVRGLGDAHTYVRAAFQQAIPLTRPLNACFFEGDADKSRQTWPSDGTYHDVLVSHTGPDNTWGLSQGDRLVAVDGLHPILWGKKLLGKSMWAWRADDPLHYANVAANLSKLIPMHATTISVVHCHQSTGECDDHAERITIADLPRLAAGKQAHLVRCDNRPFYHVQGAPADHDFGGGIDGHDVVLEGLLFESSSSENIHGLVWNSLLGGWQGSTLDAQLRHALSVWKHVPGVVLDHREGHGGTARTANIIAGMAVKPNVPLVSLFRSRANDEGPSSPQEGQAIFAKTRTFAGLQAGSSGANTSRPVALLLTWDVSASDFLPFMMKGAPSVRLFGPGPTMGAFGTFVQYSYWGNLKWSIGIEDSLDTMGVPLCGRGVVPDEIVLPKQSDLLAGRDTIHEAALRWIRQELSQ